MSTFSILTYGAAGDGQQLATSAIQAAIDACAAAGGGRVLVPSGRYRTGTLYLRSNLDLHLMAGAELIASTDRADYNDDDVYPENQVFASEHVTGAHVIIGYRLENVAITGLGTINGNGTAFFGPPAKGEPVTTDYRIKFADFTIPQWRPGQMIAFCRCRHVTVQDVQLVDAPYWSCFLHGCEDVSVRGLTITTQPQTANGDGLDIDCCRRVTVSDCRIAAGDDAITLRANNGPLGESFHCEQITITNCILSSACNAIRVGVGNATVRNCVISNIVIRDSRIGINLVAHYPGLPPPGSRIQNLRFDNLSLNAILPLHVMLGREAGQGACIESISFNNFQVEAEAGSYLGGKVGAPLRDLTLRNWQLRISGGSDNDSMHTEGVPDPFLTFGAHGHRTCPALPAPLWFRHVEGLRCQNLDLRWQPPLGRVWRHALGLDRCRDVRLLHNQLEAPLADSESICQQQVDDLQVTP